MKVLIVLLLLFLILIAFLILTPLQIVLNSRSNMYRIIWQGIGSATIVPVDKDLLLRVQLGWWHKEWPALEWIVTRRSAPEKEAAQEKTQRAKRDKAAGREFPFRRIIPVLRSFKVRRFQVEIDTDDYILNAWLFPVCYFLKWNHQGVSINFSGINACDIVVENSVFRMLRAFLRK